ncbi:hypothetical protein TNCV_3060981, partial [Trichonephila clavipes]
TSYSFPLKEAQPLSSSLDRGSKQRDPSPTVLTKLCSVTLMNDQ